MTGTLMIRKAATTEAATLTRIAVDAKKHWGYPEHWIAHWQDDLTISPEFISGNDVYVAEDDEGLVGFYALIVQGQKAELDHMWVTPAHIGTGVGKSLFLHAMDRAAAAKINSVEILSDPNAESFYRKMGAYRTGEQTSEIDGVPRVLPRLVVDPSAEN